MIPHLFVIIIFTFVITDPDPFNWNRRQGQRYPNDNMDHIEMANVLEMTATLHLKMKSNSNDQIA